jgi:hypothetical protein
MVYIAPFRGLVVVGRLVLLKLCFQVFIVLSPADEVGAAFARGCVGWMRRCKIYGERAADIDATDFMLLFAIAFCYRAQSLSRQGEIDDSSHRILVWFPVVDIRGGLSSEQPTEIGFVCQVAQDLPLFLPPSALKDEVLS